MIDKEKTDLKEYFKQNEYLVLTIGLDYYNSVLALPIVKRIVDADSFEIKNVNEKVNWYYAKYTTYEGFCVYRQDRLGTDNQFSELDFYAVCNVKAKKAVILQMGKKFEDQPVEYSGLDDEALEGILKEFGMIEAYITDTKKFLKLKKTTVKKEITSSLAENEINLDNLPLYVKPAPVVKKFSIYCHPQKGIRVPAGGGKEYRAVGKWFNDAENKKWQLDIPANWDGTLTYTTATCFTDSVMTLYTNNFVIGIDAAAGVKKSIPDVKICRDSLENYSIVLVDYDGATIILQSNNNYDPCEDCGNDPMQYFRAKEFHSEEVKKIIDLCTKFFKVSREKVKPFDIDSIPKPKHIKPMQYLIDEGYKNYIALLPKQHTEYANKRAAALPADIKKQLDAVKLDTPKITKTARLEIVTETSKRFNENTCKNEDFEVKHYFLTSQNIKTTENNPVENASNDSAKDTTKKDSGDNTPPQNDANNAPNNSNNNNSVVTKDNPATPPAPVVLDFIPKGFSEFDSSPSYFKVASLDVIKNFIYDCKKSLQIICAFKTMSGFEIKGPGNDRSLSFSVVEEGGATVITEKNIADFCKYLGISTAEIKPSDTPRPPLNLKFQAGFLYGGTWHSNFECYYITKRTAKEVTARFIGNNPLRTKAERNFRLSFYDDGAECFEYDFYADSNNYIRSEYIILPNSKKAEMLMQTDSALAEFLKEYNPPIDITSTAIEPPTTDSLNNNNPVTSLPTTTDKIITAKISKNGTTHIDFQIDNGEIMTASKIAENLCNAGLNFDTSYKILMQAVLFGNSPIIPQFGDPAVTWLTVPKMHGPGVVKCQYWLQRNLNSVATAILTGNKIEKNFKTLLDGFNITVINALIADIKAGNKTSIDYAIAKFGGKKATPPQKKKSATPPAPVVKPPTPPAPVVTNAVIADSLPIIKGVAPAKIITSKKSLRQTLGSHYPTFQQMLDATPYQKAAALICKYEPYIIIYSRNSKRKCAQFCYNKNEIIGIDFNLNKDIDRQKPFMTLVHEIGHHIDALNAAREPGKIDWASYYFSAMQGDHLDHLGNLGLLYIAAKKDIRILEKTLFTDAKNPEIIETISKQDDFQKIYVNPIFNYLTYILFHYYLPKNCYGINDICNSKSCLAKFMGIFADIVRGITKNKYLESGGHTLKYYTKHNEYNVYCNICTEIFAHCLTIAVSFPDFFPLFQKFFPNVTATFDAALNKILGTYTPAKNELPITPPLITTTEDFSADIVKFAENKIYRLGDCYFKILSRENGNKLKLISARSAQKVTSVNELDFNQSAEKILVYSESSEMIKIDGYENLTAADIFDAPAEIAPVEKTTTPPAPPVVKPATDNADNDADEMEVVIKVAEFIKDHTAEIKAGKFDEFITSLTAEFTLTENLLTEIFKIIDDIFNEDNNDNDPEKPPVKPVNAPTNGDNKPNDINPAAPPVSPATGDFTQSTTADSSSTETEGGGASPPQNQAAGQEQTSPPPSFNPAAPAAVTNDFLYISDIKPENFGLVEKLNAACRTNYYIDGKITSQEKYWEEFDKRLKPLVESSVEYKFFATLPSLLKIVFHRHYLISEIRFSAKTITQASRLMAAYSAPLQVAAENDFFDIDKLGFHDYPAMYYFYRDLNEAAETYYKRIGSFNDELQELVDLKQKLDAAKAPLLELIANYPEMWQKISNVDYRVDKLGRYFFEDGIFKRMDIEFNCIMGSVALSLNDDNFFDIEGCNFECLIEMQRLKDYFNPSPLETDPLANIDVAEYSVTPAALDVATQAEIDNANNIKSAETDNAPKSKLQTLLDKYNAVLDDAKKLIPYTGKSFVDHDLREKINAHFFLRLSLNLIFNTPHIEDLRKKKNVLTSGYTIDFTPETVLKLTDNFQQDFQTAIKADALRAFIDTFSRKQNNFYRFNDNAEKDKTPLKCEKKFVAEGWDYSTHAKDTILYISEILALLEEKEFDTVKFNSAIYDCLRQRGTSVETEYFNIEIFKNHNYHATFKSDKLRRKFSLWFNKNTGRLPANYGEKDYNELTAAERRLVDSYEGKDSYNELHQNYNAYNCDLVKNAWRLFLKNNPIFAEVLADNPQ